MHTLGALKASILDWLDETIPEQRIEDACNDGIESLWESLIRASFSLFMGGPVDLTFTTASNLLISINNPTNSPTVNVASAPGTSTHYVQVGYTYVTESGSETLMSPISAFQVASDFVAEVAVPAQIAGSLGWNCYASSSVGGLLTLQNEEPLGWDAPFQEPLTLFTHDPDNPYPPLENTTGDDLCFIKHIEALMPDGGYKAYDQAEIDSLMMRRAARNLATSSEYQTYAFDFINQRQVEIRPIPTRNINARIFFIKRPRRLRFDNAPIPFLTFPSMGFLRDYALAKLSLSIREFESAKFWDASAEKERLRLQQAILLMAAPKMQYITPAF